MTPDFTIVPVTLAEANTYVARRHRHNGSLPSAKLACALVDAGTGIVHGVAIAGLPKARELLARDTLEINRVCTDGTRNACSRLYGAILRAGKALGYRRFVTYTVEAESGSSLRAAGFIAVARWEGGRWSECRGTGSDRHDTGPKVRWEIVIEGPHCCLPLQWPANEAAPWLPGFE